MLYFENAKDGFLLTQRELCHAIKTNPSRLANHISDIWKPITVKKSQVVFVNGKRYPKGCER